MSKIPDVIVVGAGVVGMTIARELAGEGHRVAIIDRSRCGSEASWAGAGILSPCNPHRDDPLFHWQERSLGRYPAFCAALLEETGIDPEFEPCGELSVLLSEHAVSIARSDERAAAGRTLADGRHIYEMHEPASARALEPAVTTDMLGALECRQTAQVRNPRLLRALEQSCRQRGVDVREHTPVGALHREGNRIVAVKTATETIAGGAVVLCAGAWSSQIDERLAELMPIHPVRGQIVLVNCGERLFQHVITRGKYYLVPRRDGRVIIGATEERDAGFSRRTTAKGVAKLVEEALRLVPGLADAAVEAAWAGLRPGTADDRPYVGPVPGFDGLFAATGHFRSGLTLAPVTAEAVSAMISGRDYTIDLCCCRPGRN